MPGGFSEWYFQPKKPTSQKTKKQTKTRWKNVVPSTKPYTPRRRSGILEKIQSGESTLDVSVNHDISYRTVYRISNDKRVFKTGRKPLIPQGSREEDILFDLAEEQPFASIGRSAK